MSKKQIVRKKQILKTATQLFASKGYHGVTLDEIAKELGIQKASLYYYIKSKRALLEEISETLVASNMGNLDKIPKSNLSPVEKLRQFIVNQIVTNTNSTDLASIFFDETSSIDYVFYSRFGKFKKRGERDLQLILREGVAKGCFMIDDIKMASFLIFSVCNWVYKWYKPNGRLRPEDIANEYIKLLENGYIHPKFKNSWH